MFLGHFWHVPRSFLACSAVTFGAVALHSAGSFGGGLISYGRGLDGLMVLSSQLPGCSAVTFGLFRPPCSSVTFGIVTLHSAGFSRECSLVIRGRVRSSKQV
jgi:hypothetical protein